MSEAVRNRQRNPQIVITDEEIFEAHVAGKLSVELKSPLDTQRALSIAYTPGVAQVSRAIAADHTLAARYTWANRLVAVVSDGSAVLGLGDIGPAASLPVMEGKCALFKAYGDLDAIPIVLDTKDPDEIVETLVRLRPTFGAVNLEDISAPRCFEIERRLIEALDCPVMHDDQHGTAIVVLAAMMGATKVLDRDMTSLRVVISGVGAAGMACANILLAAGVSDMTVLDSRGILHPNRDDLTPVKADLAQRTNPDGLSGGMVEALKGADMFLGLSGGVVPEELIATMAPDGIVFALSNPDPEIHPEIAAKYAAVVATGRSDFLNQINNVLAFPGVFRGALDAGARRITEKMKVAAAEAIFSVVGDDLARRVHRAEPAGPARRARGRRGGRGGRRATEPSDPLRCAGSARRCCSRVLRRGGLQPRRPRADRSPSGRTQRRPNRRCWRTCTRRRCGPTERPRTSSVLPDPLTGLDSGRCHRGAGFHRPAAGHVRARRQRRGRTTQVYRDMVSALPEGVAAGDYAKSAEDKPALAVTEATADAWGGRDVTVAVRNCDKLKVGQVAGISARRRSARASAEAARISRRRNAVRGVADRAGQCGVDVDRRSRTSPPTRWCWPTARR